MLGRTWFLVVMLVGGLAAVGWAVYGSRLPPADFTFVNEIGSRIGRSGDHHRPARGPHRSAILRRLTRTRADDNLAEPGVAERWDISDDGRIYTFHLRENARWSNGDPVTAHDFHYSHPPAARSADRCRVRLPGLVHREREALQLRGERHRPGDPVEVELNPPADAPNTVRGEVLLGKLVRIEEPSEKSDGEPRATECSWSKSTAASGDFSRRRRRRARCRGRRAVPAGAAGFPRGRRPRHRRPHARDSPRRIPRRTFSICWRSIRCRRCITAAWNIRHAGLDAAGEHRHQRRVPACGTSHPRPHPARAKRQLLGPRQRALERRSTRSRSTIARRP